MWNLTSGLVRRGTKVIVICEQIMESPERGVEVIALGETSEHRRWKGMLVFRDRVATLLREQFRHADAIIHSHERSISHHVTTFHGPPMNLSSFEQLVWRSRRVKTWKFLEEEELFGPRVKVIATVSKKIQKSLIGIYPRIASRHLEIAWPGVCFAEHEVNKEERGYRGNSSPQFLFVGKEWKRKGLDLAIKIISHYRKEVGSDARLVVYGPSSSEIPYFFRHYPWVQFMGWSREIPWNSFDVLIHPARHEPFGMVVAEARANGLPVVSSTEVGAAELEFTRLWTASLGESLDTWVRLLDHARDLRADTGEVKWSWDDLVTLHLERIYPVARLKMAKS